MPSPQKFPSKKYACDCAENALTVYIKPNTLHLRPDFNTYLSLVTFGQGVPGCRNIRRGGDTVKTNNAEGACMCYIVFRSFKFAPHHVSKG